MTSTLPHPLRWTALAALVAGQFMFVVDAFIVNVAVPNIRQDLHATAAEIEAIIVIYQIAYAAVLITGGRLGDIVGRKQMFLAGLFGFTLASAWCGAASTPLGLILARAAQGGTAGLMVPQVLASMHVLFPASERPRAFGIFGIALGLGGSVGLMLGGWLITINLFGLGWRNAFLVNVPVGLAVLAAALSVVPAIEPTGNERLDLSGAALLAAGLIQTLGVVLFGRELGWPIWLAIPGIGGVVALIAFSKLESSLANRQAEPLIDPAWLRDRGFAIGLATTFAAYAGITSFLLVLTLYLQSGLGYSPLDAGLTVTALAVAFLVSSRLAARQDTAKGPILVCIGSSIMAAALVLTGATVSLFAEPPTPLIATLLALYGFGQGYVMAPLVNTVLARAHAVPPGAAAGVLVTTQQVAGAIGIALIGLLHFAFQSGGSEQRAFAISALALGGASIVTAISSAKLAGIAVQR